MNTDFLNMEFTVSFSIGDLGVLLSILILFFWLYSVFRKWGIGVQDRLDIWNPFYRIPDQYKALYRKGWRDKKNWSELEDDYK